MSKFVELVGPNQTLQLFGVPLVGITAENGKRALISSLLFIARLYVLQPLLRILLNVLMRDRRSIRVVFWTKQRVQVLTAVVVIGLLSIWFNDPKTLATALGLVTAGLGFAMQGAVLAIVGYLIILCGPTFNVGDRIAMSGVRGDVISLGFMQTTIMEMGEPPGEQRDAPSLCVEGRQYTGRVVTVTNDKLFDSPVYNYSREFPFLWEEITIPIPYHRNRRDAERILLEAAQKHTVTIAETGQDALRDFAHRYFVRGEELHHAFTTASPITGSN